jgi:hypothetical protein
MSMDPELRARLLDRLSHRAARLAACAATSHPASTIDAVLAMMTRHVTDTAVILLGETFAREMFSHVFDNAAEAFGVCRFCRERPLREDKTMCQVCWNQADSDDADGAEIEGVQS